MQNIAILIWLCLLTVLSLIFSIANIKYLNPFWKSNAIQFIKQRKPLLLILYTVLSSIILFLIIPNICVSIYIHSLHEKYGHSIDEWWLTYYFIFDSIHGSIFCTFINIIAIRVWLLFYGHKFAIATVDRIWRNIINPNDNNFFLNRRNTFGNDRFLLKILFTIWIFTVFIILLFVIIFFSPSSPYIHVDEYLFLALRVCVAFPVSIFIFIIYHQIKEINDEFHIRREMKYLSYLVAFVTFTSCINLILLVLFNIPIYLFEAIVYSFDVMFIFSSCYIQTKWVLNTFLKNQNNPQHTKIKHKVPMVDILRNRNTFEAFMRHCVNEVSVESLLFLVEVAQYKATLSSYHAPDKQSQCYYIDVQKENIRQMLLQSRQKRKCFETNEQQNIKSIINNARNSPSISTDIDEQKYNAMYSLAAHPMNKQEGIFQQFQTSILDRKWLPISSQLSSSNPSVTPSYVHQAIASKSMKGLRVNIDTPPLQNVLSDSKTIKSSQSTPSKSSVITPITPSPTGKFRKMHGFEVAAGDRSPITPNCTVSSEWIRDFALILYNKYILTSSELSINISSMTRGFLMYLFNTSYDDMFEYIMEHSGGDLDQSKQCPAAINQQLLINTYLYHVFDTSFQEIWNLLRSNAFHRFTLTETYKQFVNKTQKRKRINTSSTDTDAELPHIHSLQIIYRSDAQ